METKRRRKLKQAGGHTSDMRPSEVDEVLYEEVKDEVVTVERNFSITMTENASYAKSVPSHASKQNVLQERRSNTLVCIENKCYGQASQQEPVYAEVEERTDMTRNDAYQIHSSAYEGEHHATGLDKYNTTLLSYPPNPPPVQIINDDSPSQLPNQEVTNQ